MGCYRKQALVNARLEPKLVDDTIAVISKIIENLDKVINDVHANILPLLTQAMEILDACLCILKLAYEKWLFALNSVWS